VRGRRWLRRLGNACICIALLLAAYAAVIVVWGDPVTAYYEHRQQAHLSRALERSSASFVHQQERVQIQSPHHVRNVTPAARAWAAQLHPGAPFGRIVIGRLGISQVVVQGTSSGDLQRGPGHYATTSVPGLKRVTAIAGHRTTFGAPFRHIDNLRAGDLIALQLPYGTFSYRVTGHRVVSADDWSIIKAHGYDELVLSACHPLYNASQRWVVFARLVRVSPKGPRA
jgi:sortase A